MEELQQEINAQKGEDYLTDDTLLTELFRASETTVNEDFLSEVKHVKNKWLTRKITSKDEIILDLTTIYRNMVAEKSWNTGGDKGAKILALTTKLDASRQRLDSLEQKLKSKNVSFQDTEGKNGKGGDDTKERLGPWRTTKVGDMRRHPHTNAMMKWCPHHGTAGCYMPKDHGP